MKRAVEKVISVFLVVILVVGILPMTQIAEQDFSLWSIAAAAEGEGENVGEVPPNSGANDDPSDGLDCSPCSTYYWEITVDSTNDTGGWDKSTFIVSFLAEETYTETYEKNIDFKGTGITVCSGSSSALPSGFTHIIQYGGGFIKRSMTATYHFYVGNRMDNMIEIPLMISDEMTSASLWMTYGQTLETESSWLKKCDGSITAILETGFDFSIFDHDFTMTVHEPSHTEQGYTEYICKNCEYSTTSNFVPCVHIDEDLDDVCDECGAQLDLAAEGKCGEEANFTLSFGGKLTISGNGNTYDYTYSSPAPWYSNKGSIRTVVIEAGITSIGDYLFYKTGSITTVSVPATVTTIGNYAFYNCSSLAEVDVLENVTAIGNYAFYGCSSLNEIDFGNSITSIGSYAFYRCESIAELDISDSVANIGSYAFAYLTELENLKLPDNYVAYGSYAFAYCSSLKSVNLKKAASIGSGCFRGCNGLESISIPFVGSLSSPEHAYESVLGYIFGYTTSNSSSAQSGLTYQCKDTEYSSSYPYMFYYIPESLKFVNVTGSCSIGENAFNNCVSLLGVELSDNVKSVAKGAFSGCSALESITLPFVGNKIKSEGSTYQYPFGYIFGEVSYTGSTETSQSYYGGSIDTVTSTKYYIPSSLENVTITGGNILRGAFYNCGTIKSLILPQSIESLGAYAFYNCTGLSGIFLPETVDEIPDYAFSGCSNLETFYLNGIKRIGKYSFSRCYKLNFLDLSGIKALDDYAFQSCTGLNTLDLNGVEQIGNYTFQSCTGIVKIVIPDSVVAIGQSSFADCDNAINVWVGKNCTEIGENAFGSRTKFWISSPSVGKLQSIQVDEENTAYTSADGVLFSKDGSSLLQYPRAKSDSSYCVPDGVAKIMPYAFINNQKLAQIEFNDDLIEIGTYAFNNCILLSEISLPPHIETVGAEAFSYCEKLKTLSIPESITSIGSSGVTISTILGPHLSTVNYEGDLTSWLNKHYSTNILNGVTEFYCDGELVENIVIPDDIDTIYDYSFFGYTGLKSVTLNSGVKTIGDHAFYGCSGLISVDIPESNSLETLAAYAFYQCSSLNSIDLRKCFGLKNLGTYALYGCSSLTRLDIPSSVNTIDGTNNFKNCASSLVVGVYENSTAHTYCVENGVNYEFLTHRYEGVHVEATDDEEGYTLYTCVECGDSYTVLDPAKPVENLIAIPGAYSISLSWLKAKEASVTGYKLYRKSNDGDYSVIKTISSRNTLSYTDSNLDADVEYTYMIMAVKGNVDGEFSEEVVCTPDRDTQIPVITSVSPASLSKLSGSVTFTVKSSDNMGYVSYRISYKDADENEILVNESAILSCSSAYSFNLNTASIPDGTYEFSFVSSDKEGNMSTRVDRTYLIDNTAPQKVQGVYAKAVYDTQLTLSWSDVPDKDRAGYKLQKKTGSSYTTVSSSISTIGYNISQLTPSTEYIFRVAAYDQLGNIGEYSDDFTVTTNADVTPPVVTKLSPAPSRRSSSIPFSATVKDNYKAETIRIESSSDAVEWRTLKTESYTPASSLNCSFNIDVSTENEGPIYLRAIAEDVFGNRSIDDSSAPYVEYYIDHTAPVAPKFTEAQGYDGYISLKWLQGSESDLGSYSVYRADSSGGTYNRIASNITTINYFDRSVSQGRTYFYKLRVGDTCGNESEYSAYISATALTDDTAPEIVSISPSNGSCLSPTRRTVSILAKDNNSLQSIIIESKKSTSSEYETLANVSNINNYYKNYSTTIDIDSHNDGDRIDVRVQCCDEAGNYSAYYTTSLTIDKTPPTLRNLSSSLTNKTISVNWSGGGEVDLAGFKIYRSKDSGSYTAIASRNANSSSNYSVVDNDLDSGKYKYRVDVYDKYENKRSYYTETLTINPEVKLNPVITCNEYMEQEVSEVFSSSSSVSDYDISSYHWNFGDGTSSSKANPTKAYSSAGSYVVSLTLKDVNNLERTASKTIIVSERSMLGTLRVKVCDDSERTVSGMPVYIDLGEENMKVVYTNSSGYASAVLPVGKHSVGAYESGYLPVATEVTVMSSHTSDITLTTVKENIISGEFTVHEMTLDEIIAAGINTSDPANQQTYRVSVTLIYGEQRIPVTYIRNDSRILDFTIGDWTSSNVGTSSSGGSSTTTYKPIKIDYIPNSQNKEIIAVAAVECTASYLKQFFNATLTIFNNASEGFDIVNCKANLNCPDGLTVVGGSSMDSTIPGQGSSSETWILRGDRQGEYNLTSSFSGVLDRFNTPVTATFNADKPIYVYGADSVKLRFEVQDHIDSAGNLLFNICLVNKRDVNVYCPNIYPFKFADKLIEYFKAAKIDTEALENDPTAPDKSLRVLPLRTRVDHSDGTSDIYEFSGISPVDTLLPGEKLVYEFEAKDLMTNGDFGYFNRAIIECDGDYGSSIEVVTLGDSPIIISEDDFINEHLDFIETPAYDFVSQPFSVDLGSAADDSFERKWDQFIELDCYTDYNELVLCDFLLKKSTYSRYEKLQEEEYFANTKEWIDAISDFVMLDKYASYNTGLSKNKIQEILNGCDFESSDYRAFETVLGLMFDDGTIQNLYGVYSFVDYGVSIFNTGIGMVNEIRNAISFASAVDAYQECSSIFKELFGNASLDTTDTGMRRAMESFTNADSGRFQELLVKSKAYLIGIGKASFEALKFVYKDVFLDIVKQTLASALGNLAPYISLSEVAAQEIVGGIFIGYSLGTLISKVLGNTGDISKDLGQLRSNGFLAEGFHKQLKEAEEELKANSTYDNALYFCEAFTTYKSIQVTSFEIMTKYAEDKNDALAVRIFAKDKFVEDIASCQTSLNYIKSAYCHGYNHQVATASQKTVIVECPVNVLVYKSNGTKVAELTDNGMDVIDENITASVFDSKKIVTLPCSDDYSISISAYDNGTMRYTVLEFDENNANVRKVMFNEVSLETGDTFTGIVDDTLYTNSENYALTKNDTEEISSDFDAEFEVTGIRFNEGEIQMVPGSTIVLIPLIYPEDAENKNCVWTTDNESVATVNENGEVTAISIGIANVKAVTIDGEYTASVKISVTTCENHSFSEYEVKEATCTEPGERRRICSVCGLEDVEVIPPSHDYASEIVPPTCLENGYTVYICTKCGDIYTGDKTDATGHSYGMWQKFDDKQHQRVCSKDPSHIESVDHSWNEGVITKNPSCTEDGEKTYTCSGCHYTKTESIGKLRHVSAPAVKENEVYATCTSEGSYDTVVYCTECTSELFRETVIVNKLDHTPAQAVKENVVPATCTNKGSYDSVIYCKNCPAEISRTTISTEKSAHSLVTIPGTPATCVQNGLTDGQNCSICGIVITAQQTIPATGQHVDGNSDGKCDSCGTGIGAPSNPNICKWCGKVHGSGFFDKFVAFFHRIFASIFGAKY